MKFRIFDIIRLNKQITRLKGHIKSLEKTISDQDKSYSDKIDAKNGVHEDLIKRQAFEFDKQKKLYTDEMNNIREQERDQFQSIIGEKNNEIVRVRELIRSKQKVFDSIKNREHDIDILVEEVYSLFSRGEEYFTKGLQCFKNAKQLVDNNKYLHTKPDLKLMLDVSEN